MQIFSVLRIALCSIVLCVGSSLPSRAGALTICSPGPWMAFFEEGSSELTSMGAEYLQSGLKSIDECKDTSLILTAHVGKGEDKDLAFRRAIVVQRYLVSLGISPDRILIVDLGDTRPRSSRAGGTPIEDRRIEINRVEKITIW